MKKRYPCVETTIDLALSDSVTLRLWMDNSEGAHFSIVGFTAISTMVEKFQKMVQPGYPLSADFYDNLKDVAVFGADNVIGLNAIQVMQKIQIPGGRAATVGHMIYVNEFESEERIRKIAYEEAGRLRL